jgi:hypoxanthine phosphoribosyltransferase
MSREKIEWPRFLTDIKSLAGEIKNNGYAPNLLVAVARGGWIPTYFISKILGISEVASIGVQYSDKERTRRDFYSLPSPLSHTQQVLLIEDCLESGLTLEEAADVIEETGAVVMTAAVYLHRDARFIPDFYVEKTDHIPIMPWEEMLKS